MTDPAPPTDTRAQSPGDEDDLGDARRRSAATVPFQVVESVQTVLTALMLAFMFRAFFVEAFIIPTGSMAESLLGQHGALVCPCCGWEFNYGPGASHADRHRSFLTPPAVFCPNCHTTTDLRDHQTAVKAGDRILVHKWPYTIGGPWKPRRWDVIVFRDPADPLQNYIKRLAGLPNETIEIIDGDVFIKADRSDEFRIARKTPAAQSMLWFVVFDLNYLPTDAGRAHRAPAWVTESPTGSDDVIGWSGLETRCVRYEAHDPTPRAIVFEPTGSRHYLQDVYGYNHGAAGNYVGDTRIVAEVTLEVDDGWLRWEIIHDGQLFAAQFHRDGTVSLSTRPPAADAAELTLSTARVAPLGDGRPRVLEFAHLDYRVYVKVDGRELLTTTGQQYAPRLDELRTTRRRTPLGLRMVAQNVSLEMRGLRVDRDVYYTYSHANTQRAYAGHPFHLGDDEYFVLGDNSPGSADSREWHRDRVGPHLAEALKNDSYQVGTVRADQIVGKAFFVYLPGLLPLDDRGGWRIPDLGRMRFIR